MSQPTLLILYKALNIYVFNRHAWIFKCNDTKCLHRALISMQKLSTDIIYNYGKVETLVMYQSWDKTDIYKKKPRLTDTD